MVRTGSQTRTGVVVPGLNSVKVGVSLSPEAKKRLKWIDYYHAHNNNAVLTARHFGIARSCFNKWLGRFNKQGIAGLETLSTRPKHLRQSDVPGQVVDTIKRLRKANPEYSKYKLEVILKRDHGYQVSASTIGRIITDYKLFFTKPVKPKGHPQRRKQIERLRKPKDLAATRPGDLVEVDVKHLPGLGDRRYAFVAIDIVSKQACIHVGSTISSTQGALAWKKAMRKLGLPKAALTDNGSENLGAFAELLQSQPTTHYFARPRTPKDKPHVESFIGTLEREFIQWGGIGIDLNDQQQLVDDWLTKYHSYRPHQSLNYLTPDEYLTKLQQ